MTRNTETEKSLIEIAEGIMVYAIGKIKPGAYRTMLNAIEQALRDRDERAARILDTAAMLASPVGVIPEGEPEHEQLARLSEALSNAASAIRGKR